MTRPTLFAGTACAALWLAAPAWAQSRTFDLPTQPAATAIPEFARQARLQIIAPGEALNGVRTPALRGAYDARAALRILIAGTGLEVARDDGATITLRRRPAPARVAIERPPLLAARPPETVQMDPLVVFGRGQPRQVQLIRAGTVLDRSAPGSSPLNVIAHLPSVKLGGADAFGMNEWSVRVAVRAFAQGRLGFTLDDVPLGDMTYGNHNGLHVSRAVIGENLDAVELAQGPGSLDAASSSNLGGTIKFTTREPAVGGGGLAVLGGGSDGTFRGMLRLESGERSDGSRAYASYAYNTTDKWQGAGQQYVHQVNLKGSRPLGAGSITGFVNLSRRRESDPQDLTREMIGRLGLGWDNAITDWPLAVRLAEIGHNRGDTLGVIPRRPEFGTAYPAPITRVDDAYYDSTTARDDAVTAVTLRMPLSPAASLKSTVYAHWNKGQGLWWTPYVPSPAYGVPGATRDDAPLSVRSTDYDIRRRGVIASVTTELGPHTLAGGVWLEENDFVQARRFFGEDRAAPRRDFRRFQKDPFLTEWAYHFTTRTRQAYIQDLWRVNDDLALSAGFKSLTVVSHIDTRTGPVRTGSLKSQNHFLPQVGFRYRLAPNRELFGDYSRGMRAFPASYTSGPFATTEEAFQAVRGRLKPEISDSVEIGLRSHADDVTLLLAAYHVSFHNRFFSTPVGQGILGNPSALANVGSVTAWGLEAAASWQVTPRLSVYGSYALNTASYDDDVADGDGRVIGAIKGNNAVDAPRHMAKARIDYRDGGLFARLGMSYVSRRYYTFENDQSVDPHLVADLAVGYTFSGGAPWLEGLEAQVNVTNLFDSRYVSTIGSNDFPLRGDAQTLLAGPPRQVFVVLRKPF